MSESRLDYPLIFLRLDVEREQRKLAAQQSDEPSYASNDNYPVNIPADAILTPADEQYLLGLAIRADCELLAAWSDPDWAIENRQAILTWVLNRRGVIETPAWAAQWIAGEEG